jgi:hypothetical protein
MSNAGLDEGTLEQILEMEIESALDDPPFRKYIKEAKENANVSLEMKDAAQAFEFSVQVALLEFVANHRRQFSVGQPGVLKDADYCMDTQEEIDINIVSIMSRLRGGYGYLYYMEHEGHGVGTWDGEWDQLVRDSINPDAFHSRNFLKKMSEYVLEKTKVEYQNLKTEFENTAWHAMPEEYKNAQL